MKPMTLRALLAILLSFALLAPLTLATPVRTGHAASSTILYVKADAPANGDGSRWSKAFGTLQEALDEATDADPAQGRTYEIWIAAGTYYPTMEFGGPYARAFQMRNGVTIYGGFPADADDSTSWADRDWEQHKTILKSFDPADPDNPNGFPLFYHPGGLGLNETAVLDGVTLTGAVNTTGNGGGMYNNNNSPTLRNVIITGNHAVSGDGMYNEASSPTLENVKITHNEADQGGGMYNRFSSPTLTDVVINWNKAPRGAGMYNHGSSPELDRTVISA